jgi:phosphoribosylaminoimidazole-succinocarboxamide synthase
MKTETLMNKTNLPGMDLIKQGKVRDIYEFDDTLLIVDTDRISAFDVVMDDLIPDKGLILTQISAFWFNATEHIIPNHLISITPGAFPQACQYHRDVLDGRIMWVHKAKPLPVECIARA